MKKEKCMVCGRELNGSTSARYYMYGLCSKECYIELFGEDDDDYDHPTSEGE